VIFKIYVEGGGETNKLKTECRRGFSSFFQKAKLGHKKMPSVVACGSRNNAYDDFCTAVSLSKKLLEKKKQKYVPLLLIDSEAALEDAHTNWQHLKLRDGWDKPSGVEENQVFLMVECMESWFLADHEALKTYFGHGFKPNSLPNQTNIESISKTSIFTSLKTATAKTKTKGKYGKGQHSFKILSMISPALVCEKSPHAKKLVERLRE